MKLKIVLYVLSLITLGVSILLIIEFPNSGRYSLIAGAITVVGLALNVGAFSLSLIKPKQNII